MCPIFYLLKGDYNSKRLNLLSLTLSPKSSTQEPKHAPQGQRTFNCLTLDTLTLNPNAQKGILSRIPEPKQT